jgi:hypothetical protein
MASYSSKAVKLTRKQYTYGRIPPQIYLNLPETHLEYLPASARTCTKCYVKLLQGRTEDLTLFIRRRGALAGCGAVARSLHNSTSSSVASPSLASSSASLPACANSSIAAPTLAAAPAPLDLLAHAAASASTSSASARSSSPFHSFVGASRPDVPRPEASRAAESLMDDECSMETMPRCKRACCVNDSSVTAMPTSATASTSTTAPMKAKRARPSTIADADESAHATSETTEKGEDEEEDEEEDDNHEKESELTSAGASTTSSSSTSNSLRLVTWRRRSIRAARARTSRTGTSAASTNGWASVGNGLCRPCPCSPAETR